MKFQLKNPIQKSNRGKALSRNVITQFTILKVLVLFFSYVPDAADGATNGGGQVCKNLSNSQWTVHTNSSLSLGNDLKAKNNKLKGGHFQITLAFYYAMYLLSLLNGILEPFSEHLFSRKLVEFYSHILAKLEVIQILKLLQLLTTISLSNAKNKIRS